jgi:hypothetical protein
MNTFNPAEHPLHVQRAKIHEALNLLESLKLPVTHARKCYEELYEDLWRKPSTEDIKWPIQVPVSIEDHITSDGRETLSCALQVGRKYSLTPGQRAIIREWFNLTPTPLVEVTCIELFSHYPNLIRRVVLRSDVHVEEQNRKHVLIHCTIDSWGKFLEASIRKEEDLKEISAAKSEAAYRMKCKIEGRPYLTPEERAALRATGVKRPRKATKSIEDLMGEYD